ncbi:pentatricopeptide repeat-containing protein At4g14850 [Cryptomeria japonica]|uniref:pentatricopeptide repeat-containing protein At4g14850 n=1 Tax=Cryptomeria japonica TaxID=3369 RepID=UPI0027D9D4B4|nr:pentatricopeptide repeat-containing protein At4g14850 [Cryptomeria japonica]
MDEEEIMSTNFCKQASGILYLMDNAYKTFSQLDFKAYGCALQDCASSKALTRGKQFHANLIKNGYESVASFLNTNLLNMYAKCHDTDLARKVFDKMAERSVVSWTAMIAGYVQNGDCWECLKLFSRMRRQEQFYKPNEFTFPCVLKACAGLGRDGLSLGKQVHSCIVQIGFDSDVFTGSALLDMYAKCGVRNDALQMFDEMPGRNIVSWNAMITGCVINGCGEEGFKIFQKLRGTDVKPNYVTFCSLLYACVQASSLEQGKQVHGHLVKSGFDSEVTVGNGLVDLYGKLNHVEDARKLFDSMPERNVVSWSTMIAGYVQNGYSGEALSIFSQLHREGSEATEHTSSSVLKACAVLASLEQGKQVHTHIIKMRTVSNVYIGSALVDMYGKSGSIDDACQVFDRMPERNLVSWNAMISACSQHGHAEKAIQLFEQMQCAGYQPNYITLLCVLSACSHAGLVGKGLSYFNAMSTDYGIMPEPEHYACIIDLLGRAGLLDEALEFMKGIPLEPTPSMWGALLGASRVHGNMVLAKQAAERLFELDPGDSGTHVLLSNIYAASGRWDDVAKVRNAMKNIGMKKEPGCSWVGDKNKVHEFHSNDKTHPLTEEIYSLLEKLSGQMKESGYVPDTNFVLLDVDDQQKEQFLSYHCEKLALAFGLISIPFGLPIRITKNLRICGDCHTFIKFSSGIVGREIVVRDTNRFHRFKDNLCSCGDYW